MCHEVMIASRTAAGKPHCDESLLLYGRLQVSFKKLSTRRKSLCLFRRTTIKNNEDDAIFTGVLAISIISKEIGFHAERNCLQADMIAHCSS